MRTEYYDGTKLLSLSDINGKKPEIYLCTSNRTAGKTTYFGRRSVNRFKKYGKKFALLYRYNYELDDCADKFFKDISSLFFPDDTMISKRMANGIYHELFINEVSCGYALAINNSDTLKKMSHLFNDVDNMIFDEFQSETNHYCNNEVRKLIGLHNSIARGQGKQSRYCPVVMLGNPVSLINPYYVSLGISSRLRKDTKFLRGNGFVLEQSFNQSASNAQKESAFNRAFASNEYIAYSSESVYLNDDESFIEKPDGRGRYLCTIRCDRTDYGVREYAESGVIYVDDKADKTFRLRIAATTEDHRINYVMLKRNDIFISNLRWYFERGCFRFKNLQCKEAILKTLSY